jgi:anti-sigma regulatory factor (Ser/Thr protein kinase)
MDSEPAAPPAEQSSTRVTPASLRLELAAELPSIGAARHTVSRFLALAAVEEEEAESLVLVTSELCTNAVEATSAACGQMVIGCRVDDRSVEVEVTNRGEDFAADISLPHPESTSGRGLFIVRSLMDRLMVRHHGGRTTVTATKHLHCSPRAVCATG